MAILLSPQALNEELEKFTPTVFQKEKNKKQQRNKKQQEKMVNVLSKTWSHFPKEEQFEFQLSMLYSAEMHKGERRKDFITPYELHVLGVTCILVEAGLKDYITLCAALLHDVVENTEGTFKDIQRKFGGTVAIVVKVVTRDKSKSPAIYWQAIISCKYLHAMWRAGILKLADRIQNLDTLSVLNKEKAIFIIRETEEWFPKIYKASLRTLSKLEQQSKRKNLRQAKGKGHSRGRRRSDMLTKLYEKLMESLTREKKRLGIQ
jgi:guanosine-3',5'-bis(diphosphate) 3'-pyrophosphohydrolase